MKVKALLRRYVGFELNHRNSEGLTLLHTAIQWGHLDVTNFLLRKGTNVNVPDVRNADCSETETLLSTTQLRINTLTLWMYLSMQAPTRETPIESGRRLGREFESN